jgi:arylsulfatase A-like enzyme
VSPTCAPTRAALLTGRHEFKNGVTHTIFERERLTPDAITIAQVLKGAGYTSGIFGKWHLGDEPAYQPNKRGFDETFTHGGGGIGQTYPGSCGDAPGNTYFNPAILHNGRFEKTEGYCTDVFFKQAMKWIKEAQAKHRSFFAYIPLNAAHDPLQVPIEYYARHAGQVGTNDAKFFGMIENLDDNFGVLMRNLKEWGMEENTLVIFMTDNGGTVGTKIHNGGRRGAKNTPYQGGTRVPSFWRWPAGFKGNFDCDALTAHVDIFRTLASIGLAVLPSKVEKQVEGRNLMPLLKRPDSVWKDRYLVTHVGRWNRGEMEQAKYKGCSNRNSRFTLVNNIELYDLKHDPAETKNVAADFPDEVRKLQKEYEKWWEEVKPCQVNEFAMGPTMNPYKELFWKQMGGGPSEALLWQMEPMHALTNDAAQKIPLELKR